MSEKSLAILGTVALFLGSFAAMAFASDAEAVTKIFLITSVGASAIATMFKLGDNTKKTEKLEQKTDELKTKVNGLLDKRVESAYREAYARGKIDGASEADEKNKVVAETAAVVAKDVAKTAAEVAAEVAAKAITSKES